MTTEEKARAYDEAIAKAQKELQSCGSKDCDAARQIYRFFPELSETEDEKIRKNLINFLDAVWHLGKNANFDEHSKADCAEWISWLEKQKSVLDELEMTLSVSDDAYLRSNIEKLIKELKEDEQ